jgi:hypothetical protein
LNKVAFIRLITIHNLKNLKKLKYTVAVMRLKTKDWERRLETYPKLYRNNFSPLLTAVQT